MNVINYNYFTKVIMSCLLHDYFPKVALFLVGGHIAICVSFLCGLQRNMNKKEYEVTSDFFFNVHFFK